MHAKWVFGCVIKSEGRTAVQSQMQRVEDSATTIRSNASAVSVSLAESNQPTSTDERLQHILAPRGKFAIYYSLDRLFLLLIYRLHTRLTAVFRDCTGKPVPERQKPIWILLKQETVSGNGISWAVCKSAPRSRQITTPAPHHSVFTGRMPFLPPNQHRQSTESTK